MIDRLIDCVAVAVLIILLMLGRSYADVLPAAEDITAETASSLVLTDSADDDGQQ